MSFFHSRALMGLLEREAPKWCPECERNVTHAERHAPDCPFAPEPVNALVRFAKQVGVLLGAFGIAALIIVLVIVGTYFSFF